MFQLTVFVLAALFFARIVPIPSAKRLPLLASVIGDDSDVKIFPSRPMRTTPRQEDKSEQVAAEYVHNKQNGNIDIAKELGYHLAAPIVRQNEQDASDSISLNIKVLQLFAAQVSVNDCSPSAILADTANQSLLQEIYDKLSAVYQQYTSSGVSTMYKLALDNGKDEAPAVGGVFAKICERAEDEAFVRQGITLYKQFLEESIAICKHVTYDL